ncbi:mandelate racemase [Advenella kashmirensis WT001]|uniref:Mandelate racemase n=1 Tax=Advenella kashmirensis (strain DSM 17095 / LMG 22695 / WT001) TaxID=1036672 RepID=I3U954_ADVKW|nr:enolase C-terminal domain-like protein [Advenella kashmirensis]AFK61542.1 mandelate racemase [Advenella kashmirensis WT001]
MKITRIIESPVHLKSNISNALVNFSEHTVSLVAVVTDQIRNNKPVVGLAFNSIGRYAQSGILNSRMIPRIEQEPPDALLDQNGMICPEKVLACALRNEKPGGHGDRAAAASALELAIWDLNGKLQDCPVSQLIRQRYRLDHDGHRVFVYAAGGYYYEGEGSRKLKEELQSYRDSGFTMYKMKIGGASLSEDMRRIEDALTVAGEGWNLAVDANGRFDLAAARAYARSIQPYQLRWFEEAGDPLDFELNAMVTNEYEGPIATGENLFSRQDVKNLTLYGGMRCDRDIFQMDSGLAYGITEYARMLNEMESRGFSRKFCFPHGGQLMALQVVAGFGLGGSEVYPGIFQPMGGYGSTTKIVDGMVNVPDAPGFGFECKPQLFSLFAKMIG